MRNLHPTRLLTSAATFAAALILGGLTFQFAGLQLGNAKETTQVPRLGAETSDAAAKMLPASGTFSPVVKQVAPAVVSITAERKATASAGPRIPFFFGPETPQAPRKQRGTGSGVIVSGDGLVITNDHVIDGATEITVHLTDKREFTAEVVGTDPQSDIALLRVPATDLPKLALGNSETVEVGDIVLALGNPFGIGQTVTMGIVGATGRGGLGLERYENFIQTDAAINPGNSGGALVNAHGELIGINTAIIARGGGGNQGVGFAVPVNMAHHVLTQLASNGRVSRGYMGVGIQEVDPEIAAAFGAQGHGGALISKVEPDSPAANAGLEQGDIIREVNGKAIEGPRALSLEVAKQAPGSEVELAVVRNGTRENFAVKLGEHPEFSDQPDRESKAEPGSLGLGVQALTPELAEQLQIEAGTKGVVVAGVRPGSVAEDAGLRRGDVIEQVNRRAVDSTATFKQAAGTADSEPLLLLVNRRGDTRFVVLKRG